MVTGTFLKILTEEYFTEANIRADLQAFADAAKVAIEDVNTGNTNKLSVKCCNGDEIIFYTYLTRAAIAFDYGEKTTALSLMRMKMNNPWEGINPPKTNLSFRRSDDQHPFDFFWAKDVEGDYYFMYVCSSALSVPEKLPVLSGIQVSRLENASEKKIQVLFKLIEQDDWDLFHSLCLDLMAATRHLDSEVQVVSVILKRLSRWQIFLNKNRSKLLSESEQKGLLGELIFIRDYLTIIILSDRL